MNDISYKVMKCDDICGNIWYKVACGCGSNDHVLKIEFEYDKDAPGYVWINFEKKLAWSSYWGLNKWYKRFWKRLTGAFKIFFNGHIEVSESFLLDGEEHIESFISALREGQDKMRKYREIIIKE
uniref:Uncharacterized protein n=1 Tax=viral metagenome TaxID=1070528 RepID=A0A6M3LKB6_9ZZZZ